MEIYVIGFFWGGWQTWSQALFTMLYNDEFSGRRIPYLDQIHSCGWYTKTNSRRRCLLDVQLSAMNIKNTDCLTFGTTH